VYVRVNRCVQRFQKLYEVAEKEASVEKRQLTLLHQQRVQAAMDDRKRRLLQKFVEAVDVDTQDIDVSCNSMRQASAPWLLDRVISTCLGFWKTTN